MNVVVVAPHPDDETLGCGGALAEHAAAGDRVTVLWLTSGEAGTGGLEPEHGRSVREAEALAAAEVLGVVAHRFLRLPDGALESVEGRARAAVTDVVAQVRPEVVYAPHASDGHADHRAAFRIARDAVAAGWPQGILHCYEVWTPLPRFDVVVPIDGRMDRKLAAVACYPSQLALYRFDRAAEGLAAYRGALAGGCSFAEVFACP